MPTETDLSELFAELADEELLARLRSGSLTEGAAAVVRRELAARGIAAEQALSELPAESQTPSRAIATARDILGFLSTRVLCFPLRAVQGVEPLWAVFVFGLLILAGVFKLSFFGLQYLLFPLRAGSNALMVSYVLLAAYALTAVWLGAALWRTARRNKSSGWSLVARTFAVLVVLNCVWGSIAAARFIDSQLKQPQAEGPSVMDSLPDR
jgi:hypothetical protein